MRESAAFNDQGICRSCSQRPGCGKSNAPRALTLRNLCCLGAVVPAVTEARVELVPPATPRDSPGTLRHPAPPRDTAR